MPTITEVRDDVVNELSKFDKLPRFIGASLHSETFDRIFTRGIATDGGKIGEYSIFTIATKKKEGRFTSKNVNLRNTDTLANSWIFDIKDSGVEIGFLSNSRSGNDGKNISNSELVPKLEDQYGEIFDLTSDELKLIDDLTDDFTKKLF